MPILMTARHEYLDLDCRWYDECRDRTGTHVNGLLFEPKPIILKAFEDLKFEENLTEFSHSERIWFSDKLRLPFDGCDIRLSPGEWRRVSLKQACASLKDRRLARRLQTRGGTCMALDETDIGFYLMLWVGVPLKQAWDSINKANECSCKLHSGSAAKKWRKDYV